MDTSFLLSKITYKTSRIVAGLRTTLTGMVPTNVRKYVVQSPALPIKGKVGDMDYLKALKVCQEALEGYSQDCIGSDPEAQKTLDMAWHIIRKKPSFFRLTVHWPQGPEEYFFTSRREAELFLLKLQDETRVKITRDEYDITPIKVIA